MRRLFFWLPAAFLLATVFCPTDRCYGQTPVLSGKYSTINGTYYAKGYSKETAYYKDHPLRYIKINEETALLCNEDGTFLYLGSVRQLKSNGSYYPSGEGICRLAIKVPETGESAFEYCFCPWKRGSRHGTGIVKHFDGNYKIIRWKWNKYKSTLSQSPSSEEKTELDIRIQKLEKAILLMGID